VGEGTVSSVSWGGREGVFYYLRGSNLYRVLGAELFARALYASFLEIGSVIGQLPFEFDPYFDNFWIAPDARSLLVSKARRSRFYFPLDTDAGSPELILPHLMLPRSSSGIDVLWSPSGVVTALVSMPAENGVRVNAWRLNLSRAGSPAFEPLPPPGTGTRTGTFSSGLLSPDGSMAVFWGTGGIVLYDYIGWRLLSVLSVRPGIACRWLGNEALITGDDHIIERVRLTLTPPIPGRALRAVVSGRDLVCLSGIDQAGFEESGSRRILAKKGESWYVTDGRIAWTKIDNPQLRTASQVSSRYRVYLESQALGFYENLPMIRNISSVGTFPLVSPPVGLAPGPRIERKPLALCFDLYDDDRGLPEILNALNRCGVKATFFLNGEFIRRHPLAASEIAGAGHESASMFFALIDLSDARYLAGEDFVTRGLARNEDEYFRATGKELALLWHPPWYTFSPDIASSAAKAGYTTALRDLDPMDWVSRDEEKTLGIPQRSPAEMIDFIMGSIKSGTVLPLRLGLLPGGRSDYLFNRINVLLDALIREGYTLTTVSGVLNSR
jgi:peptidoglycan/xylan/chitin deacetylase (PgdA/CDA1 family)